MQANADVSVVLMAGGFGRRLGDITRNLPKPLVPVGSKPIIQRIIENFVDHGMKKFFITVHHLAHQIETFCGNGQRFGAQVGYIYEDAPRGTAGGLSALKGAVDGPVIVSNCDLLVQVDLRQLMSFHRRTCADLTVCSVEHEVRIDFGVLRVADDWVKAVDEKPSLRVLVASGIYVLRPEAVDLVPDAGAFDMPDLIRAAIAGGLKVNAFHNTGEWIDIGRVHDLELANRRVAFLEQGGVELQKTA
jgi:NDP-sugar pyrophosphorylase family protein